MIVKNSEEARIEAARIIANGGVIAFRTDTFYGLGADPLNLDAVRRIRALKGREDDKPILLLIGDLSEVDRFIINQSESFKAISSRFWPGPLTLIGVARPEMPEELTAGTGTIGVRLPNDDRVRLLVRLCGGALTATSANVSGSAPARDAEEVHRYFADALDMIIDGGSVYSAEPSTVVDVTTLPPQVLRKGAIPVDELGPILSIWR